MDILTMGSSALIVFGGVWIVDTLLKRFTKVKLSASDKFMVSIVVALVVGFVPADLGNEVANRVKEAVALATTIAGGFQILAKTAERV